MNHVPEKASVANVSNIINLRESCRGAYFLKMQKELTIAQSESLSRLINKGDIDVKQ